MVFLIRFRGDSVHGSIVSISRDTAVCGFISYGDYSHRDLASHDKDGGWIMHGCRSGYVFH
ncbi:hypothetical protein NITHO_5730002 [Nitrolancea hollandica Lb]|uniref:Uncharacterized protein n=1 Tax=Nitrolancea hollandica Lb TaxID=1129897 RepID=I4EM89_9BACT|nr:hypothetical protein NITHO_5730002 [Nitrolancea hollandica Lb]